jgi:peptidoglycan hydrolase-like protein with peptidoglycan-binding domain
MFARFVFSLGLLSATALVDPAHAAGARTLQVIVSKDTQSLNVYDAGQLVATSKVSTGKPGHDTPTGIFSVLEKQKYHESNLYSAAPMPFMQRLTWSGIALHEAKSVPNYPASHGCVRLPAAFAKSLYQITQPGVHVIISDRALVPATISSRSLFRPEKVPPLNQLLSDAQLRPSALDASLKPVEVAMNVAKPAPTASAPRPEAAPLRILITRRGERETLLDVQDMLGYLGFDAGIPDGHLGQMTVTAANAFKLWKNLPVRGPLLTDAFLTSLYDAAGRGAPPQGQIMVRQNFKPLFEAAAEIRGPQIALGTHFIEAIDIDAKTGDTQWNAVSLDNQIPAAAMKRLGIVTKADAQAYNGAVNALERIIIPDDVRARINAALTSGSSITISDLGQSEETGAGTDFITVTHSPS